MDLGCTLCLDYLPSEFAIWEFCWDVVCLTDAFIVCMGHCFEGCPPPVLCCPLRKQCNTRAGPFGISLGQLGTAAAPLWRCLGFHWACRRVSDHCCTSGKCSDSSISKCSGGLQNKYICIWGQIFCMFGGCMCRCGPEGENGITAGIEIHSDLFQISNQSFWTPEVLSQSFWFWSGSA